MLTILKDEISLQSDRLWF